MKFKLPLQHLALALLGLFLALVARGLAGYPNCAADEHNWAVIAEQVERGVDWPISGPLHFALVQALAHVSGLGHEPALAFVGLWSVPLLVLLMLFAYARLGVAKPENLLMVLSCSTYFLDPMLASRPQQWGQVLVLLGVALGWRAVRGLGAWWPYALVLVITASVHILSFAILAASSLVFWAILYVLHQTTLATLAKLLLCVMAGLVIFALPGGPYAAMLGDLRYHHLQISPVWSTTVLVLAPLAAAGVLGLLLLRRHARRLLNAALPILDRQPTLVLVGFGLLALGTLGLQAVLLPAEAWAPYRGSILLFGFSQSGNMFFIGLLVSGLLAARQSYRHGHNQLPIQTFTILLLSMGIIAVAALVFSFWMLHTNWLLRVLNYSILFMAPFSAIGLSQLKNQPVKWSLWLVMMGISLVFVVRLPGVFSC